MPEHAMITVTAFKWVPPFAAGQVRDHRVRWMLNEIDWDYELDLIDPTVQASDAYLAEQPFGQVPVLRETGRPALFESGAIVLDLAERSGKLWPADPDAQAQVRSWVIAALNSVEPYLSNVAEVDFFTDDETLRRLRRPGAVAAAKQRLGKLSAALGERKYLVGDSVHCSRPNAGLGPAGRRPRSSACGVSEPLRLSRTLSGEAGLQEGGRRSAPRHRRPRSRGHGLGSRDVRGICSRLNAEVLNLSARENSNGADNLSLLQGQLPRGDDPLRRGPRRRDRRRVPQCRRARFRKPHAGQ